MRMYKYKCVHVYDLEPYLHVLIHIHIIYIFLEPCIIKLVDLTRRMACRPLSPGNDPCFSGQNATPLELTFIHIYIYTNIYIYICIYIHIGIPMKIDGRMSSSIPVRLSSISSWEWVSGNLNSAPSTDWGLNLLRFKWLRTHQWFIMWLYSSNKLDDGWPESVEEQSLLLLVWTHYITRQYIKDVL